MLIPQKRTGEVYLRGWINQEGPFYHSHCRSRNSLSWWIGVQIHIVTNVHSLCKNVGISNHYGSNPIFVVVDLLVHTAHIYLTK